MACDVLSGELRPPGGGISEDDYWVLDHQFGPVVLPRFLILKPKRHCEHIAELTADEMASFVRLLPLACQSLTSVLNAAKTYVCSFGESVKHVHFYVVPRYAVPGRPEMPANGFDVLRKAFRDRLWVCSDEEAALVAERVREEMTRAMSRT